MANKIQKQLLDYDLVKLQLESLQAQEMLLQVKVRTQADLIARQEELTRQLNKQLKRHKVFYRRPEIWAVIGLTVGILIAK